MYTDYYGFTDRPFQLTPDARFYFDSRTHKKAMAYLGYGLAQGEGFIVITGDVGAGKSTLVAHLMATIDRSRLNAINLVSTQVEGDDMLRLAAQGMGLPTEEVEKAQLLERVEHHLEEQARKGKRTLLIVDEAQNLPTSSIEELRMLSNFQVGGQALLQIFLLGQPEFRDKLQRSEGLEQLRQRVIATHHLDPMDANEVEPYITHRLGLVGWDGRPAFNGDAFAEIYNLTGGVPRKVNQLAGRVLLHASVEELDRIDAETISAVAEDMADDASRVQPLRAELAQVASQQGEPRDLALDRRISVIEDRLDEQERALRRVLTLLVDWVEKDQGDIQDEAVVYRHNAA
jgi:putative secretion ATPase (PEP-CTERM system associated)